jgi:carbon storage regulator
MLALTRRVGETVVIGDGPDQVRITVIEILGGNVRLAFDAPRNVNIARQELLDQPKEEAQ